MNHGYAAKLDQNLDLIFREAWASFGAMGARELARYEREYAFNRKFQTKYIGMRIWAFLTEMEVQ